MKHRSLSRLASRCIRCLLIAGFMLLAGTGAASARNIFPDPLFPVGSQPVSVATADFNGDGKMDLAAANFFSQDVSILLGRGHGEFEPERRFAVAGQPTWVVAADFNADGKIDLAVTEFHNSISIFLGAGDGSFAFNGLYTVGDSAAFELLSMTVADLNLDGVPDLAVTASIDIAVLLGKGDGTFQAAAHFPAGQRTAQIAVVDFNGDGFPDLAVTTGAHESEEGVLLFGHGNGQFDAPVSLGGVTGGEAICTGDFNRDGHPDLAFTHAYQRQISVLLGDGQGGIARRETISYFSFPQPGPWLGTADFNGDGAPDLATAGMMLPGHGDGTFGPVVPLGAFAWGGAIADFDADGSLDLAGGNHADPGGVFLLLNDGHGHLGTDVYYTDNSANMLVKGDFNGDGLTDLATVGNSSQSIALLLGKEDGTFAPGSDIPVDSNGYVATIAAGDFDGDGRLDLALASSDFISMYRGVGDGTFQIPVRTYNGVAPTGLVTGDFNGDGREDLVSFRLLTDYLQILLGKSDSTFDVINQVGAPMRAWAAAVGDFDADGKQDLAVAYPSVSGVTILAGKGDGTFETHATYGAGDHLYSLAVGDLNGDGKLDLAAGHANVQIIGPGPTLEDCCDAVSKISVLLGRGDGSFDGEVRYESGESFSVGIADFDHDGHMDLVASSSSILLGSGDGTFGPPRQYSHFGAGVVDDFNQDGWPDVAAERGDIIVALNLGSRDTTPPQLTVTFTPNSLWPPNSQMLDITAHVQATDDSGGIVEVKLASIEGVGKAASPDNVAGAEIGTADFSFQLRAVRRAPRQEAYYRITYTATDAAGNQASVTGVVQIPHDVRRASGKGHGIPPSP